MPKIYIIGIIGRNIFQKGVELADIVIYLNISANVLKRRTLTRWIKQKNGIEKSPYKPTIKMIKNMKKRCLKDLNIREQTIMNLEEHSKKLVLLNEKTIKNSKMI
jgi:pantothenate kinase